MLAAAPNTLKTGLIRLVPAHKRSTHAAHISIRQFSFYRSGNSKSFSTSSQVNAE